MLGASSGTPITLTTTLAGDSGTGAWLPLFGAASISTPAPLGPDTDLTSDPGGAMAQLFPREGTITNMTARFSTTLSQALIGSTVIVSAAVYIGPGLTNVVSLAGRCILGPLTGVVTIGTVTTCSIPLNIPVTAGELGVIRFDATATGIGVIDTLVGNAAMSLTLA